MAQSNRPGDWCVLLMAYGGPGNIDEVEPYVMDVRGGRPLSPGILDEIRGRYRQIGGKSPLLEITQRQAMSLEELLQRRGYSAPVFVGMRHWFPYIRDAVQAIAGAGFCRVVAICMAPQYSDISIGAYISQYEAAVRDLGLDLKTSLIKQWYDQPELIQAFAAKVSGVLGRYTRREREALEILFTAHSLPKSRLRPDDPYDRQQRETAAAVASLIGCPRWSFAYQSQGYSNDEWLGPSVEERMRALAEAGIKNVLVVPTGFVCDHVEILYDVDIAFRNLAVSLGMNLQRTESLNEDPLLVQALAALVQQAFEGEPEES
jgi:protoporphyrin/coproporphyrin ferrochelatase